ncbi:hypothetical protein ABPG72_003218 [Tetrahymena utriculariae]
MEIETAINQLKIEGQKIEIGENDYDFVEEKPNVFEFNLTIVPDYKQKLLAGKFQVKKIIFANNGHPQIYLQTKVNKNKDFQKVADLNFSKKKQLYLSNFYISTSNPDLLVVVFNYSIDDFEFKFSEFFFQYIDSSLLESVVVLDTINQEYIISTKKATQLKNPALSKFTTSKAQSNSLFPQIEQIPVGNRFYGITADIITHLELQGIRGEVLLLTPVEQQYVFKDIQALEVVRNLYPQLSQEILPQDARPLIQKLNEILYNSGMFM